MNLHVAHGLLACPHCGRALEPMERRWACPSGHSFDVARQGYLNLSDGPEPANADTAAMLDCMAVPQPGDPMIPVDTPTTDDARGVDPICTRDPECDLHGQTLTAALTGGTPVALSIATPAYCQTAICGPILDLMLQVAPDYPDIRFLHTEVYTDMTASTVAPGVEALNLAREQGLTAGTDGEPAVPGELTAPATRPPAEAPPAGRS